MTTIKSAQVTPSQREIVTYRRDGDVVQLVIDDPTSRVNTLTQEFTASLTRAIDRLEEELSREPHEVAGVVVSSGKGTFFAGGDLRMMSGATEDDVPALFGQTERFKSALRRLESCGRPVVAVINGAALGGGYEIALAAHRRVAADGRYRIGLPESTLGLLPGGGGIIRTVRMFGLEKSLNKLLLPGSTYAPTDALSLGLIDDLVSTREEALAAAAAWIAENTNNSEASTQPWERRGWTLPGGNPTTSQAANTIMLLTANLRKKYKGAPSEAQKQILQVAVEGVLLDFETASRIESRHLVSLIINQQSKNMTQTAFFDKSSITSGNLRPAINERWTVEHCAVIGAGMMGNGIALAAASAGIDVQLLDVSIEAAERGKAAGGSVLDAQIARGLQTEKVRDEILQRIHPTTSYADIADCDFVIEAVFESMDLKHKILSAAEDAAQVNALIGSNTSTLPIAQLAEGVSKPESLIGIHFFSPVDRMQLVEIIAGPLTAERTIARAVDFVTQIGKIPIIVNDSRGFFTSRVFECLIFEAATMVGEGIDPVTIERGASLAGFPGQPLAMIDEVSLALLRDIKGEARKAVEATGGTYTPSMAEVVVGFLLESGRPGKSAGAGFYDYPSGDRKRLWAGLWDKFPPAETPTSIDDVMDRLTFIMSIETYRCLDEGVLRSVAEANVGSVLGIGFPVIKGGALQYIDGYTSPDGNTGALEFITRADELADRYGERFRVPDSLRRRADRGKVSE